MKEYTYIEKLFYSESVIARIQNEYMPIMLSEAEQEIVIDALVMYQKNIKKI